MRAARIVRVVLASLIVAAFCGSALAAGESAATAGQGGADGCIGPGWGYRPKNSAIASSGGTKASEAAVAGAISWLAKHQGGKGNWRFDPPAGTGRGYANPGTWKSDSGATALALLPFLGIGQTHRNRGRYQSNVASGISWLVKHQKPDGDLSAGGAPQMPSHAWATIVLCEAYGMTGDRVVGEAARQAVKFTVALQDNTSGGWSEGPSQTPTMWMSAWQIMALRMATLNGLDVRKSALDEAAGFLDRLHAKDGVKYGLTGPGDTSDVATAMGLLSRMYVDPGGWLSLGNPPSAPPPAKTKPAGQRGVEYLEQAGPSKNDAAYNWYGTLVMYNIYGPPWDAWNRKMRRQLIETQVNEGDELGSWWSADDAHAAEGGRLWQTATSVLILEVYYQYLPLFYRSAPEAGGPQPREMSW